MIIWGRWGLPILELDLFGQDVFKNLVNKRRCQHLLLDSLSFILRQRRIESHHVPLVMANLGQNQGMEAPTQIGPYPSRPR